MGCAGSKAKSSANRRRKGGKRAQQQDDTSSQQQQSGSSAQKKKVKKGATGRRKDQKGGKEREEFAPHSALKKTTTAETPSVSNDMDGIDRKVSFSNQVAVSTPTEQVPQNPFSTLFPRSLDSPNSKNQQHPSSPTGAHPGNNDAYQSNASETEASDENWEEDRKFSHASQFTETDTTGTSNKRQRPGHRKGKVVRTGLQLPEDPPQLSSSSTTGDRSHYLQDGESGGGLASRTHSAVQPSPRKRVIPRAVPTSIPKPKCPPKRVRHIRCWIDESVLGDDSYLAEDGPLLDPADANAQILRENKISFREQQRVTKQEQEDREEIRKAKEFASELSTNFSEAGARTRLEGSVSARSGSQGVSSLVKGEEKRTGNEDHPLTGSFNTTGLLEAGDGAPLPVAATVVDADLPSLRASTLALREKRKSMMDAEGEGEEEDPQPLRIDTTRAAPGGGGNPTAMGSDSEGCLASSKSQTPGSSHYQGSSNGGHDESNSVASADVVVLPRGTSVQSLSNSISDDEMSGGGLDEDGTGPPAIRPPARR